MCCSLLRAMRVGLVDGGVRKCYRLVQVRLPPVPPDFLSLDRSRNFKREMLPGVGVQLEQMLLQILLCGGDRGLFAESQADLQKMLDFHKNSCELMGYKAINCKYACWRDAVWRWWPVFYV